MKNFLLAMLITLTLLAFCGCNPQQNPDPDPDLLQSQVQIVTPPQGVELYSGATVKVEQTPLPLYQVKVNNEHSWSAVPQNRSNSGVGYFSLKGKTQVSVAVDGMTSCIVRPLSSGVEATVENGIATFTIKSAGTYSVEPNGDTKQAFFLFVSDIHDLQEQPQSKNLLVFSAGLHTSQNNPLIVGNTVVLQSDTTVVLEEGAVVRAKFVANNQHNITICGKGIIDGSAFERNPTTGKVTVPLDFNYCSNVTFKDFSVLDPAGWCVNWYFCTDSQIDGIKIISSRSNGDGISLQSCKNIEVQNCFLRTWDDSLVVKNYPKWSNRNEEGATQNITFSNCFLWTDLAQSMEIGYETVGEQLSGVTFKNITVLHNFHKPVISIHNGNNANVQNVTYENITVEDASMGRGDAGSNSQLCEFSVAFNSTWSSQHKVTALGSVQGVTVKNLTVLGGNVVINLRVAGSVDNRSGYGQSTHRVTDVIFQNVWINGKRLQKSAVASNQYAQFNIVNGDSAVTVPFVFSQTEQTLAQYSDNATVTVK